MSITGLQKDTWDNRKTKSNIYTNALVSFLKAKKHFGFYESSKTEEDKDGVDYWIDEDRTPIQFKLRTNNRFDIPVNCFQPWHGNEVILQHRNDKKLVSTVGRDFRGIRDNKIDFYYVAVSRGKNDKARFVQIYKIGLPTLRPLVMEIYDAWCKSDYSPDYFTKNVTKKWISDGNWNKCVFETENGQIWWKKNSKEAPKFNIYINHSFKEWSIDIASDEADVIKKLFDVRFAEAKKTGLLKEEDENGFD